MECIYLWYTDQFRTYDGLLRGIDRANGICNGFAAEVSLEIPGPDARERGNE